MAGEKDKQLTESSGGDVTSKSFMGLAVLGAAVPLKVPKVFWLNIFTYFLLNDTHNMQYYNS